MSKIADLNCPICKSPKPVNGLPCISCSNCGFEYAFVRYLAGDRSRKKYRAVLKNTKQQYFLKMIDSLSNSNRFTLTSDSVAYISKNSNILYVIKNDSSIEKETDVLQFSASERNRAILFNNGRVKADGDNSYGQCDVHELNDIVFILCAPNCLYAVNKKREVSVVGAVLDSSVSKWKNIKRLSCGSYHVLGLTTESTVKIAGSMLDDSIVEVVSNWTNVRSVSASTDCSVALFYDGTVAFAGRKNDPRNDVDSWKKIVSVSVDSSYVIGITEDGEIKLAGACKPFLDMGRSSAKNWKNVLAVTCSRSGIAAVLSDGTLRIVGNFSGNAEIISDIWMKNIKIDF